MKAPRPPCRACGGQITSRDGRVFCSVACKQTYHTPAETRFWRHVRKAEGEACWEWTASRGGTMGYGRFAADGRNPGSASRFSWELHYGPIPDGLFVCHHCDNPPCVRPDHLFLGDHRTNAADMVSKNRGHNLPAWIKANPNRYRLPAPKPGASNPSAKLTEQNVRDIRAAWPRESQNVLARRFGVTQGAIWSVLHHRTWV
jgi:hypothetical protein